MRAVSAWEAIRFILPVAGLLRWMLLLVLLLVLLLRMGQRMDCRRRLLRRSGYHGLGGLRRGDQTV